MRRFPTVMLIIGLLGATASCRRSDDPAANIASKGSAVIDRGLLVDPAGYQPANYPGMNESGGGGDASSGAEDPAVRTMIKDSLTAMVNRNVAGVFAALDEAQIEPLLKPLPPDDKSVKDALIESVEKGEALVRLLCVKSSKKEDCDSFFHMLFTLSTRMTDAITGAVTVQMLSPEAASIGLDPQKLRANVVAALDASKDELAQVLAQAAAEASAKGTPNPLAGQTPESLIAMVEQQTEQLESQPALSGFPLHKAESGWKVDIPIPLSEEHAAIASEALSLAKQFMDKVMEKLQAETSVDQAGIQRMFMEVAGEMMPQFMELQEKAAAITGEQPSTAPDEEPPKPEVTGDTGSEPPNPRMPRDPRRP